MFVTEYKGGKAPGLGQKPHLQVDVPRRTFPVTERLLVPAATGLPSQSVGPDDVIKVVIGDVSFS